MKDGEHKPISRRLLLIISVAAFCCLFVLVILNLDRVKPFFAPPSWVSWQAKEITDEEGLSLKLENRSASLVSGEGEILWESPGGLKVQDGFITDVDRDGTRELLLLLWKRGRFGEHRPFWIDFDEKSYSQHIFIYDIEDDGSVHPKWFASDIGLLAGRMKLMEKDPALILVEDIEGNCSLWGWESFGLKSLDNEVVFTAYGDNIIHTAIYEYAAAAQKGSFDFLYEPFLDEIKEADIAAVNAETVLVDKASAVSGYPSFGSPIEAGEALAKAGFDVVSCANNHALDKGIYGIDVTSSFYGEKGICCIGIQPGTDTVKRPYEIISKNGIRFALLSYTYGTNGIDVSEKYPCAVHYLPQDSAQEKEFLEELLDARQEADFVVVFVHWGQEYQQEITDDQRHIADLLAQGGADVVIGTHPHVVQETQILDRPDGGQMLVYYSLGNFRSDQRGDGTDAGEAASFTVEHCFDGVRLKSWDAHGVDAYWKSR